MVGLPAIVAPVVILAAALGGLVMLVGAADAGAEQAVMAGIMADDTARYRSAQAPFRIRRLGNGEARKRDDARNRHDDLFHDTLRFERDALLG